MDTAKNSSFSHAGHRLRPYQVEALEATRRYLDRKKGRGRAPVIVVPTGGGKSHIIAEIAMRAIAKGGKVLILAHRKELLAQNREKLTRGRPELAARSCYFSAGLAEKRLDQPLVFAGIQSLFRYEDAMPDFRVVLIDEAHRVPTLRGKGMYPKVIRAIREASSTDPVFVGFTATPFRSGQGYLWSDEDGRLFDGAAFDVDCFSLVEQGYLAPLRTEVPGDTQIDVSSLKLDRRAGEFTTASLEAATEPLVRAIAENAWRAFNHYARRSMMVFTASRDLTAQFVEAFEELGVDDVVSVLGDDLNDHRDKAIRRFKEGTARIIVSCGVLTEGFDAPAADLIVVARAMASPGLWVQICGRGMRTAPDKRYCLILDHGANRTRLGPINAVQPTTFGQRDRKGDGEGGGEGPERVVRLTMNPDRGRMFIGTKGRPDELDREAWQMVLSHTLEERVSRSSGNPMIVLTLTLTGKPDKVTEYFVVGKGKRSHQGRRYSRIFGHPMPDTPLHALCTAREAVDTIRRVTLHQERGWTKIQHIERAAISSEERRQAEAIGE